MEFYQLNVDRLRARRGQLRATFGINRPWDDMANAPPLIRRHRGMVAVALQLLDADTWTEAMSNVDKREEHFKALANAAAMVEALDRGKDFLGQQRGMFWSAYYSAADSSGQNFVVSLPPDFKKSRAYPLFVSLHGAGGVPTPQGSSQLAKMDYIEVSPWGRGAGGSYRALGEIDVLEVIRYMKEWYKIDEDRVYIVGASMGGRGT